MKAALKELRQEILDNLNLKEEEREDLKAAILLLIMYLNHYPETSISSEGVK